MDFLYVSCVLLAPMIVWGIFMYTRGSKHQRRVIPPGTYKEDKANKDGRGHYDVAIVGAGPAGATCAYYLAKSGVKVLLLEKKQFPRDKHCGDAVCKTAIEILHDMGIYQKLLDENKAQIADSGGLVSPGGLSYIGRTLERMGGIPPAVAVKRIHLDEAIARRAQEIGADLRENSSVKGAQFSEQDGLWTISLEDDSRTFQALVLVCADGAPSKLATQLGYIKGPPTGTCSRAYVEGGTHKFNADGVMFYNSDLLPGYAALFRHPNDELNYCCYIIPGNPKVTNDDLSYWHEHIMTKDPNVSRALGKNFKIERMKGGSLRLGGEPVTTDRHLIIVGDAAGMIDPLTGEGIHHAMEAAKIAAEVLIEAIDKGNYSAEALYIYHERWMNAFGNDFSWSMKICQLLYRYPILIDAATAAVIRKGDAFLAKWGEIMTGRAPKRHLLKPEFVVGIGTELVLMLIKRLFGLGQQHSGSSKHTKKEGDKTQVHKTTVQDR